MWLWRLALLNLSWGENNRHSKERCSTIEIPSLPDRPPACRIPGHRPTACMSQSDTCMPSIFLRPNITYLCACKCVLPADIIDTTGSTVVEVKPSSISSMSVLPAITAATQNCPKQENNAKRQYMNRGDVVLSDDVALRGHAERILYQLCAIFGEQILIGGVIS